MSRHGSRGARRSGFTLVELLVVVGIIALLIGILMPTLSKARESGRRTACLANLRSLGSAMYLYAQAHRDRLPNANPPGKWYYSDVLVPLAEEYVGAAGAFHCPGDADPPPGAIWTSDYLLPNSAHVSYEFYSVWWQPEYGPMLVKLEGRAPLAWDLSGGATEEAAPDKRLFQNHATRGGNVVYADGHAEWQPADEWDRENWPHPAQEFYPVQTPLIGP